MALSFLSNVIDKTNERIEEKKRTRKEIREHFEQKLNEKTLLLKQEIEESARNMEKANEKDSKTVVEEYVNQNLLYPSD